jgi:hypothetical protein
LIFIVQFATPDVHNFVYKNKLWDGSSDQHSLVHGALSARQDTLGPSKHWPEHRAKYAVLKGDIFFAPVEKATAFGRLQNGCLFRRQSLREV